MVAVGKDTAIGSDLHKEVNPTSPKDAASSSSSLTMTSPEKTEITSATTKQEPLKQAPPLAWDGPDDPANPQNWTRTRKWTLTFFLAAVTFSATFASSLFAAATVPTAERFHVSTEVTTLETSLFVTGFAAGPIMFGPLSEQIGRKPPLMAGILLMTIFHIPVAVAQNIGTILVGRFLAGIGGSSPISVIGGMLVDFWDPVNRGIAIAGFAAATFAGPMMAPIVGGFMITAGLSWRWLGYLTIILGGVMFTFGMLVVPETHNPTLLRRRARKAYQDAEDKSKLIEPDRPKVDLKTILVVYFMRPFVMLTHEPILVLITIYMAFVFGIVYLDFSAWAISFEQQRGWKPGVGALPFLSITIGVCLGCGVIIYLTKTRFARKMHENNGVVVPEERLIPMMIAAPLIPISLFWWAWTSNPNITWVPQVLAGIPFGAGVIMISLQGLNYIIDVYKMYANSGLAGNTMCRCLVGAGFPLFAGPMYAKLGVPWATSLLGFLSVAMVPIPVLFYIYGERIRGWSKFAPTIPPA